jgi:NusA-like KH domain protein
MAKTFDMQFIRYINLFSRVSGVPAKHCFAYNNMLVFVVPKAMIEKAIGKDNFTLKKVSSILGKRVRVVSEPHTIEEIQKFTSVIVSPIEFQKIEVVENDKKEKEIVISTDNRESKAMLIGRGRARESELKNIFEQYFNIKNLRIN